ncbi:MAG: DUF6468 domain-containing protein [Pseudomonadota bacterium]
MSLTLILDGLMLVLLAVMIGYAATLSRRLRAWRADRAELARLIERLGRAAERAEAGLGNLKRASEETGAALETAIAKGRSLRDDLAFLVERAEPLADRMAASGRTASGAGREVKTAGARTGPEPTESRSAAERDLIRALKALR